MFLFILFSLILGPVESGLLKKNAIKIYDFKGVCDGYENLVFNIVNVTTRTDRLKRTLINGALVVGKDFPGTYYQEITITKCNSIESLDSCLTFQKIKFPDTCLIYLAKNQIWSTFFAGLTPRLVCPIKKGVHVMKNAYFNGERLPFPFDPSYYWKTHILVKDTKTKKPIFCMEFLSQIIPIKN